MARLMGSPPKVTEAIVGFLIPPACRVSVAGDLHERYTTHGQYIAEAICTIPFVVASRIRRTTDPQVLVMEAFALYISFLGVAWKFDGTAFLYQQWGYFRLAIPAAVALLALTLGDAYAVPGKRSPIRPILESTLSFIIVCLSQAALMAIDPRWVLPTRTLIYGGMVSIVLVSTLRMCFPPCDTRPRNAT
jgi:hypothetical protein